MYNKMNAKELFDTFESLKNQQDMLYDELNNIEDENEYYNSPLRKQIDDIYNLFDEIEEQIDKIDFNYYEFCDGKWRDWASHRLVNKAMYKSIYETTYEEVEFFLERAKQAIDEDDWMYKDWIEQFKLINSYARIEESSVEYIFAIDCLENDGVWSPYKQTFVDALEQLAKSIHITFREEI